MTVSRRLSDSGAAAPVFPALTRSERAIFDLVRREPGLSRAAISQRLSLSPAMLTKTVGRFCQMGLMAEEREPGPRRGRGQPALRLKIRTRAVTGIGVSLTTTGIATAAADPVGNTLYVRHHTLPASDMTSAMSALEKDIGEMLPRCERVAGIGIWVPAMVGETGDILDVTPSQRGIDFDAYRHFLTERFGLPVWFESKAAAIHEAMRSADLGSLVYMVFLDYGVGGSVIEDMRVFKGGFGQASNLGALVPDSGPRPSLPDLQRFLGASPQFGFDAVAPLLEREDARLEQWIATRGAALSAPLSAVVQLINPTAIVLGGLFPQRMLEALIARIDLTLYDHPGRAPVTKPVLRVAHATGPDAMAAAAASVPIARCLTG